MFLKFYGMVTMNVVSKYLTECNFDSILANTNRQTCWGSRDHADLDNSIRMRRVERTSYDNGSSAEKGENYEKSSVLVYRPASKSDDGLADE